MHKGIQYIRARFRLAEKILPENGEEDPSAEALPQIGGANSPMEMSKKSGVSVTSELSGLSASPYINPDWSDILRDAFEERAAILEYDAGYERGRADYMARRFTDELASEKSKKD